MKTKPRILQNKDKLSYMENTPVGQLIWEMSAPSIVGVLAYNAYNLFDTLFISQWAGTAAVGGVSVSFPFFLYGGQRSGICYFTGAWRAEYRTGGENCCKCIYAFLCFSTVRYGVWAAVFG